MSFRGITFRRTQHGAVLVAVLVISMILILLLSAAHSVMSVRLQLATDKSNMAQEKAVVHAKMQELIYLTATQRKTRAGIGQGKAEANYEAFSLFTGDELRVDGHIYSDIDRNDLQFAIQAENGLLSLNTSGQFWLRKFLEKQGLSLIKINQLLDNLADYADDDLFSRSAGAENDQRKLIDNASFAPNFLLQHPDEALRVSYWSTYLNFSDFNEFVSTSRSARLNVNAMPERLWKHFWPDSSDIKSKRASGRWVIDHTDFLNFVTSGVSIQDEFITFMPDRGYIINVWGADYKKSVLVRLGNGAEIPFKIYRY